MMSMRTLIELNHDMTEQLCSPEFQAFLRNYLSCGDGERAERLERFGARVIGMRHHSDRFVIKSDAEGFPPQYLVEGQRRQRG